MLQACGLWPDAGLSTRKDVLCFKLHRRPKRLHVRAAYTSSLARLRKKLVKLNKGCAVPLVGATGEVEQDINATGWLFRLLQAHVLLVECTAVLLASPLSARRRYARSARFSFPCQRRVNDRPRFVCSGAADRSAQTKHFSRSATAVGILPLIFVSNDVKLGSVTGLTLLGGSASSSSDSESGSVGAAAAAASLATLMQRCTGNVTVDGCALCLRGCALCLRCSCRTRLFRSSSSHHIRRQWPLRVQRT